MAKCEFKSLPDAKLQRQRNTSFSFSYDEINISETLTNYAKGKTYYIHTYGCQANYRDEEIISGILTKAGFIKASDENADIIILNTCAVRENAEDKVFGKIGELKAIKAKNITAAISGKASVWADEKRMYELMQNLLSNAVNYNKDGGKIDVIFEETANASVIRVKDTGIGIAKENIPHLCERFYRVDKSRSQKTGGTGLGLAIVKHICALYDADISIKSEIDVGTEFVIVFNKNRNSKWG